MQVQYTKLKKNWIKKKKNGNNLPTLDAGLTGKAGVVGRPKVDILSGSRVWTPGPIGLRIIRSSSISVISLGDSFGGGGAAAAWTFKGR